MRLPLLLALLNAPLLAAQTQLAGPTAERDALPPLTVTLDSSRHETILIFGVSGEGLRLSTGRRYRVVAEYDNPTPDTLIKGAMGSLSGIFAPENLADWPAVDPADSLIQRDLRFLSRRGGAMRRPAGAAPADSSRDEHRDHQHAATP